MDQAPFLCQLQWEEAREQNQDVQLEHAMQRRVSAMYDFVPDLSISIHHNAQKVVGDTPPRAYFSCPYNLGFHDLTKGKVTHPAASQVLGLSSKFIPAPKFTAGCNAIDCTLSCFDQDAHLKIHFARSESEFPPTRLYNKSTYRAPLPTYNIGTCFCNFELSLCTLFKQCKGCPNFTNFQKQVFNDLLANDTIVYAHSDKNLGPVAIKLTQYIKDGLKHLTNTSTYMLLTKAEALQEDKELWKQILKWCTDHSN